MSKAANYFLRLRVTQNALQLPVFLFFLLLWLCQPYPEYRWIQSKKLFHRLSNSWYNSVIWFYKKEIFWVYGFSEQDPAKWNSLEATW